MTPTITIRGITARIPEGCPYFVLRGDDWRFGRVGECECRIDHIAACVAEHWWRKDANRMDNDAWVACTQEADKWHGIAEGESDA